MLKRYNVAADLICLAHAFYKKGQVKDALKLMVRANEEEDIQELVDVIDEENNSLDPMVNEAENADEIIEDVVDETEEAECDSKEEAETNDEEIEAEDDEIEELPSVEEVMSKVMTKKRAIANLKALKRGKVTSRLSRFRR